jgi:protein-tyrosine phosphatase
MRRIDFEGIENFRDFGDYAAAGGRLKRGRLWRSGHHGRATDADLARMADLGLSVIVDLRRANEREREPCRRWDGFAARVVESDIPEAQVDEWREFVVRSDLSAGSFRDYMLDYYRKAPFWSRHLALYRTWLEALASEDGPVLVHCAAGKDRTGIACALVHHMAGVHHDDLVADYLLTNDAERMQRRLPLMAEYVRELNGRTPSDEAMFTAMRVEAEYLEVAFRVIGERYGSLDGYLEQALGVDAAMRQALLERVMA